jgi:uncharacterized protein (DUF58 family)
MFLKGPTVTVSENANLNVNVIGLSQDVLKKIRRIELRAGHLVDEAFSGGYLSTFKGQGMEWEDVRGYVPGDDVRRIDWKVTARLGETQVKQYREERENVVYLLIDVSRSCFFGSTDQLRIERLAELAAALAFCTTRGNDKLGVLFFADDVVHHIPPGSGRSHIFKVIREILTSTAGFAGTEGSFSTQTTGSRTRMLPVTEYLCRMRKRRTVVFVLSDFWFSDFETSIGQLARRHSVRLFMMRDRLERRLPQGGLIPVRDLESGRFSWVDLSSSRARDKFEQLMSENVDALQRLALRFRLPVVSLQNDDGYLDEVVRSFRPTRFERGNSR